MDNVGIVVEDLAAAIEFFGELGLVLEGHVDAVLAFNCSPVAKTFGAQGEETASMLMRGRTMPVGDCAR